MMTNKELLISLLEKGFVRRSSHSINQLIINACLLYDIPVSKSVVTGDYEYLYMRNGKLLGGGKTFMNFSSNFKCLEFKKRLLLNIKLIIDSYYSEEGSPL